MPFPRLLFSPGLTIQALYYLFLPFYPAPLIYLARLW